MLALSTIGMGIDCRKSYQGKKVFITGHTGFKGSWLALWLARLGAKVFGYALEPPTSPSLFKLLALDDVIYEHQIADIRDSEQLKRSISRIKPDVIFHLAAQSLVRDSYESPVETVEVNTMGTIHLMEAVRQLRLPTAMLVVTSDKCYENREWLFGYRETDPLGGHDPYSASKAGVELFVNSWRNSFFPPELMKEHGVRIASARAGNVVGGGDWTKNNLVPDCIRALQKEQAIRLRNPLATRPWQHVLEALSGYMLLGSKLLSTDASVTPYCGAFNFGPPVNSNKSVRELVEKIISYWGSGGWVDDSSAHAPHEAGLLSISIDKAYHMLNWYPKLNFDKTMQLTVDWYKGVMQDPGQALKLTLEQITSFDEGKDCPEQQSDALPIEIYN